MLYPEAGAVVVTVGTPGCVFCNRWRVLSRPTLTLSRLKIKIWPRSGAGAVLVVAVVLHWIPGSSQYGSGLSQLHISDETSLRWTQACPCQPKAEGS
jgi:hypothetical protein